MKTRLALGLIIIAIAGTAAISLFTFSSVPKAIQLTDYGPSDTVFVTTAQAAANLSEHDTAKIMRVRVSEVGQSDELVLGSFSRIGFVSESSSDFLLESLPSIDKKPFYKFVKDSMENKSVLANPTLLNIKIDIFSGNYDLIETLSYEKCSVSDYFVHAVDSRGKIPFLEGYEGIEIREVTKFSCVSFTLILDE